MTFWVVGRLFSILVILMVTQSTLHSHAQEIDKRLIERIYRAPTDREVEILRAFLRQLADYQLIPRRVAYRCEGRLGPGVIFVNGLPEKFYSIHAIDRDLDAERDIQLQEFAEKDDPRLRSIVTDRDGYADSRTSNAGLLPRRQDQLRIGDQIYRSNNTSVPIHRDKYKRQTSDRSFEPITFTLLPLSNFADDVAAMRVSDLYGIEKLKPDEVSVDGDSFVVKFRDMSTHGPTGSYSFIEFVNSLPVTFEQWRMLKVGNQLLFRTVSQWKKYGEQQLPIRIEALQIHGSRRAEFEANLEWRLGEDVPEHLFERKDLGARNALDW